jgi:NAD(P)-dependent dehydrogenase (short-subunit alcohol dehydrogenase family)
MRVLADRTALVTGSSRGIGAGIARLFAREGAKVALHGRDTAALSEVRREIEQAGGQAIHAVGDVTSFDDIEAVRGRVEEAFGPIGAGFVGDGRRPGPGGRRGHGVGAFVPTYSLSIPISTRWVASNPLRRSASRIASGGTQVSIVSQW